MTDNLKYRGTPDNKRINIHESYELTGWAKRFGVSPAQVIAAVKAVGTSAEAVQRHLATRRGGLLG